MKYNKTTLQLQPYIWLYLAGAGLQVLGIILTRWVSDQPWADFLGGFLFGLSCVAMGVFIFLATATLQRNIARQNGESQ